MFCQKCGKEITDDAVFCPACGNSVSNGTQTGTGQAKISKEGKLHCPKCKSFNISVTTESSVNGGVTTHHGGVSATHLSSTHRNYWICSDCGTKFRNIQSLEEEIYGSRNHPKIFTILTIITAILGLYLLVQMLSGWFGFLFAPYFIGVLVADIVFLCFLVSSRKKLVTMNAELQYLKQNCFD